MDEAQVKAYKEFRKDFAKMALFSPVAARWLDALFAEIKELKESATEDVQAARVKSAESHNVVLMAALRPFHKAFHHFEDGGNPNEKITLHDIREAHKAYGKL